jgi:hypothetical protein
MFVIPRTTVPGASLGLPSAFVPTTATLLLGALAALLALRRDRFRMRDEEDHGRWGAVTLSVALMCASIAAMAFIGYFPAAVFLVAALMLQLGVRAPLPLIGLPLASAAVCWWVARHVLQLPLP